MTARHSILAVCALTGLALIALAIWNNDPVYAALAATTLGGTIPLLVEKPRPAHACRRSAVLNPQD
jgi:hypothetical protein